MTAPRPRHRSCGPHPKTFTNAASAVHTFCHALPDTWHQMGVILSATAALDWFAGVIGAPARTLTAELGENLRPPSSVTFQPYLSGERTPHNDPHLTGGFSGLTHQSDRNALTHAVLEGVAFTLRDNLVALRAAGTEPASLLVAGGGSQSRYWLKLIATVLQLPVHVPAQGETAAALGAARLGAMAATGLADLNSFPAPQIKAAIAPCPELIAPYEDKFRAERG